MVCLLWDFYTFQVSINEVKCHLTLFHSERPKLYGVLAILRAVGLSDILSHLVRLGIYK